MLKKLPLTKVDISVTDQLYFQIENRAVLEVQGKYGKAVLTLPAGHWFIREIKKPLSRWHKILKFFKLYKEKHFIRAQRIK